MTLIHYASRRGFHPRNRVGEGAGLGVCDHILGKRVPGKRYNSEYLLSLAQRRDVRSAPRIPVGGKSNGAASRRAHHGERLRPYAAPPALDLGHRTLPEPSTSSLRHRSPPMGEVMPEIAKKRQPSIPVRLRIGARRALAARRRTPRTRGDDFRDQANAHRGVTIQATDGDAFDRTLRARPRVGRFPSGRCRLFCFLAREG